MNKKIQLNENEKWQLYVQGEVVIERGGFEIIIVKNKETKKYTMLVNNPYKNSDIDYIMKQYEIELKKE